MARIDDKGRVVIPPDVRRVAGIEVGDEVDVSADGGSVRIGALVERCAICRSTRDVLRVYADEPGVLCATCREVVAVVQRSEE